MPLVISEASAGVVFNLDRVTSWLGLILIVVFVSSFFGDDVWWPKCIIISMYTKAEDHMDMTPHKFDGEEITLLKDSHLITMQTFRNGFNLVPCVS